MNKYQKRINKCAKWLLKTFDMTWRKAKIMDKLAIKTNDDEK